jgi:fucose 4-O-acetylase-like acetyltransferase
MRQRKNYIDITKGISIIAIVLLHYDQDLIPKNINNWIGSFMIVSFYFTSGWLFGLSKNKISIKELIKKRIRSLGVPYLWFSLIIILFDLLLIVLGFKEWKFLAIDLYKTITFRGIGTLWFLPALFGGEIIFLYLRDKNIFQKIMAIIVTILYLYLYFLWNDSMGHFSDLNRLIDVPIRTLYNILQGWIVIQAGYYICKLSEKSIQTMSKVNLFMLTFFTIFFGFYTAQSSVYPGLYYYYPIIQPLFVSIICPFSILLLAILTERFKVNRFFIFWGVNSLILMVIHYSILMELCLIFDKHYLGYDDFVGIRPIYYFIVTMLLQYIFVFFINSKAKFLLGQK